MLKTIYTLFLSILLAVFVGVGISVFYTSPVAPKEPFMAWQKEPSATDIAIERQFNDARTAYDIKLRNYNRNVSVLALISAVVMVVISLLLSGRAGTMADSLTLGGVFTLIYSLGRSFASQNNRFSFFVVTISLLIVIVLGYLHFKVTKQSTISHSNF